MHCIAIYKQNRLLVNSVISNVTHIKYYKYCHRCLINTGVEK